MTPAQLHISIPEPCGENWNAMTVHDALHRHCGACDRVLVDFSQMSDAEIISFLQRGEKTCGRFRNDQINRVYAVPKIISPRRSKHWWLLLPSLFGAAAATAQTSAPVATQQLASTRSSVLSGRVTDSETNQPIEGAYIHPLDNSTYAVSDANGNFTMTLYSGATDIEIRQIGYLPQRLPVSSYLKSRIEIKLQQGNNTLSQVEINADHYGIDGRGYTVGISISTITSTPLTIQPAYAKTSKAFSKLRLTLPFGKKKHP